MNYTLAKYIAEYLVGELSEHCLPGYCQVAGGVRREKADVHDLEVICVSGPGAPRPEFGQKRIFASHLDAALFRLEYNERLGRREKDGEKYKKIVIPTENYGIVYASPFYLDLFIVRPETWGVQFVIRTGPAEFSKKCVTARSWGGWLPDFMKVEDGLLWDMRDKSTIPTPKEVDFFYAIGLPWIEPGERQHYLEKH